MKKEVLIFLFLSIAILFSVPIEGRCRSSNPFAYDPYGYSHYGYDTYEAPFTFSLPYTFDYLPYRSYDSFFAYAPGNYYYTFR